MFTEKRQAFPLIESILAFLIFILHYTSLIDISIYTASPLILLPLCIAVAMFRGELTGIIFSLICGLACDSISSSTSFNTLVFMFTGFFVGLLAKNIFNRNFRGALALALISSAFYFGLKWILEYFITDVQGKVYYLLVYTVPSAFYTSLFIIPFFLLQKWIMTEKKSKTKLI